MTTLLLPFGSQLPLTWIWVGKLSPTPCLGHGALFLLGHLSGPPSEELQGPCLACPFGVPSA